MEGQLDHITGSISLMCLDQLRERDCSLGPLDGLETRPLNWPHSVRPPEYAGHHAFGSSLTKATGFGVIGHPARSAQAYFHAVSGP